MVDCSVLQLGSYLANTRDNLPFRCRHSENWYKKKQPTIDGGLIGKLRCGEYDSASAMTKKLWMVVTTRVAPYVAKEFKGKERQRMTLFSDVVSVEMEAFICWILKVCYEQWVSQWQQDDKNKEDNKAKEVRTKPKGKKNFADAHFDAYLELLQDVKTARESECGGVSWDRAIQLKVQEGAKRGGGLEAEGNGSGTRVAKKKRILPVPGFQLPGKQAAV